MSVFKCLIFLCILYSFGDCKFLDTLTKCSVKDEDGCLKSVFQNIVTEAAQKGIPELNVPPADPLKIDKFSINLLETLTGTLSDGIVKGIRKCVFNKYQLDFEKLMAIQDITCDLTIQGTVTLSGKSPAIEALLGTNSVDVHGKGKVKIEKLNFYMETPFQLLKNDNGDVYLQLDDKNFKYIYDVQNMKFSAEKIVIGNQDICKPSVALLNDNYRTLLKSFGKMFLDRVVAVYCGLLNEVLRPLPLKFYITEDVSVYIDN
ncbi:uncharacterized protein LOC112043062 [Bicyclus anynana]|uniref:Uncharacterized protein LOC112043062 n=1 Tax=Bicyclus anynana TaxID=110368 RepID=A0ABM3LPP3_BICAN|nr:uncharacterized protein LOC112043062 [Bicyclus anynana]